MQAASGVAVDLNSSMAAPIATSAAHQQSHDRKRTHAWISDTLQAPTREELAQILTHLRIGGLVNPRVLAVFSHAWCKMPVQRGIYDSDSDSDSEDDVNAQWHDGLNFIQNDESMCKQIGQVDPHMASFVQQDLVHPRCIHVWFTTVALANLGSSPANSVPNAKGKPLKWSRGWPS